MNRFAEIQDKKAVMEFLIQLSEGRYGTFNMVRARIPQIEPSTYWKVIWEIGFPFTYNVSNSNTDAYIQPEMNQVVTEVGFCYSYNSFATIYNDPK